MRYMTIDIMHIELTTPEKYLLIERLANRLQYMRGYRDGDRAEFLKITTRLLELAKSLPDDSDGA